MASRTTVIDNETMTGTAAIISTPIFVEENTLLSLQFEWSGTPTGTLEIFQSNRDTADVGTNPAKGWTAVPIAEVPVTGKEPAGADGNSLFNIAFCSGWAYLVRYTNTAGVGVLTCNAVVKVA